MIVLLPAPMGPNQWPVFELQTEIDISWTDERVKFPDFANYF